MLETELYTGLKTISLENTWIKIEDELKKFCTGLNAPNLKSINKIIEQTITVDININLDDLSGNLAILFSGQ